MSKSETHIAARSAAVLSALGNTKRLLIMRQLLAEEVPVNELARRADLSQSAISQHLARLRKVGLVQTRRDRQTIFYTSRCEFVARIIAILDAELTPKTDVAQRASAGL